MKTSLEEKRKEIFEAHKIRLGADAPLMRQKPSPPPVIEPHEKIALTPSTRRNKIMIAVAVLTAAFVITELVFFASELGWLD